MSGTAGARASAFTLLGVLILLCFAQPAFAATFTSPIPAADTTVAASTANVSFGFAHTTAVTAASVQIGATTANAVIHFGELATGHWENDGYDQWWVPDLDFTRGTASASFSGLKNGPQDVTARITDSSGVISSYSWRFGVAVAPGVSTVVPAANTTVTTTLPVLRATLSANGSIATSTVTIDVDGVVVPVTVANMTASYTARAPLSPGAHTAHVRFRDGVGGTAEKTWSFVVAPLGHAVFSSIQPAPMSLVASAVPTVSFLVTDTIELARDARVYVDGREVVTVWGNYVITGYESGYDPDYGYWTMPIYDNKQCSFWYRPPVLEDGPHDIAVLVRNTNGFETVASWRFVVGSAPVVTATSPSAGGYSLSARPEITVDVADNNTTPPTAVMTVDGVAVQATWDTAKKRFTATPTWDLVDRADHTVAVTITDALGFVTAHTWTFHQAAYPVSFSAATPTGTVGGWAPRVSVRLADTHAFASTVMGIDGAAVPVQTIDRTPGYWEPDAEGMTHFVPTGDPALEAWFQPTKLGDGPHSVVVTATTVRGMTTRYEWQFSLVGTPTVGSLTPTPGVETSQRRPVISARVADNGPIARYELVVDGAVVQTSTGDPAEGLVSYTPPADLVNDMSHEVTLTVWDGAGFSTAASWSFGVQLYPDMAGMADCKHCHTDVLQTHPMTDCGACHPGKPLGPCGGTECHAAVVHPRSYIDGATFTRDAHLMPKTVVARSCKDCHAPYVSGARGHAPGLHDTTTGFGSCEACHVRSLTREHARRVDAAGAPLTCDTCHASARDDVKRAITAGDVSCAACHGAAHEAQHADTGLDPRCGSCHAASLTRIHETLGCGVCHASSAPAVAWAISLGEKRCTACHLTVHGLGLSDSAEYLPKPDGFKWSGALDASLWGGEDAVPIPYVQGKRVFSDRTHAPVADIWAFYRDQMATRGWNLATPAPASAATSFSVTFEKNGHAAIVRYYDTEVPGAGPSVPTGYRVDLLYH